MELILQTKKKKKPVLEILLIILISLVAFSGSIEPLVQRRNLIYIAMLGIMILMVLLRKEKVKIGNILQLQWLFVLLFLIFNLIYTIDISKLFVVILQYVVFTFLIIINFKESFYENFQKIFLLICTILGIIVIITVFNKNFVTDNFSFLYSDFSIKAMTGRVESNAYPGLLGEVAYSAFAMNIGIALIISKYFSGKKLRIINWIQLLIFIIGVMLSFKRSLLLIPIFATIFLFLVSSTNEKLKKGLTFLVIAIGIVIAVINIFPETLDTIGRLSNGNSENSGLNGREQLWGYAFEMFKKNPVLGLGFSSYTKYCYSQGFQWDYLTHNIYIELLGETGIIGFVLFIGLFILLFIKTLKVLKLSKNKEEIGLINFSLFMQIVFLIYGLSGNPLYFPQQMIVYVIAISIISNVLNKKIQEEKEQKDNVKD